MYTKDRTPIPHHEMLREITCTSLSDAQISVNYGYINDLFSAKETHTG